MIPYSKLIANSTNCDFCDKFPESFAHVFCLFSFVFSVMFCFCDCEFVRPIWDELIKIIKEKHNIDFTASNFDKKFGFLVTYVAYISHLIPW